MPKIDLTVTITTVLALVAIISPIFTAIINNHYQLKLKRMELKQQEYLQSILHKQNALENYLCYLNEEVQHSTKESQSKYAEFYPLAYVYLPKDIQHKMSALNHSIVERPGYVDFSHEVDAVADSISKELADITKNQAYIEKISNTTGIVFSVLTFLISIVAIVISFLHA